MPPLPARRPRILGFGPIGCALLVPLGALIWIAASGYDLQHQLLRLVDALFGWDGLAYFVTRILVGHFFSLQLPTFGLIALCVVLLPLHFAPRPPARWCYAALAAWALLAPTLPWLSLDLRPPAADPMLWRLPFEFAGMLGAAALLSAATRSPRVGIAIAIAGAAAHGLVVLDDCLLNAGLRPRIANAGLWIGLSNHSVGFYGWHLALAAVLSWWTIHQWRTIKPEHACQSCGYDLRGLTAPTCPECDAPTPASLPGQPITTPDR